MLLKFTVENFASIGKKQTISLMAGKARGKPGHLLKAHKRSVLKFTSIYGANAAGKSNIIKAMHFGKHLITNGYLDKRYLPVNKAADCWEGGLSEFSYTMFLSGKLYEYGFALKQCDEAIVKEWLYETNSRSVKKLVFMRDFENKTFDMRIASKDDQLANRLAIYFTDTENEKNTLFLHSINSKKGNLFETDSSILYLKNLYRWFLTKMKFVYPNGSDLGKYSFINYPQNHNELIEYLKMLGLPITDLTYVETSFEQMFDTVPKEIVEDIEVEFKEIYQRSEFPKSGLSIVLRLDDDYYVVEMGKEGFKKAWDIQFTHSKGKKQLGAYSFSEESDGTKRVLELLEMLTSPETNVTYIVDEIDRSLHPLLTEQLVSMYLNHDPTSQNQLIITTHESRLLNLQKLRKDEIYFATNNHGESQFVRLDDYESGDTRADLNIALSYLNGRYGGIPELIKYADV
jgi:AAA15 family ATPase/GTPase